MQLQMYNKMCWQNTQALSKSRKLKLRVSLLPTLNIQSTPELLVPLVKMSKNEHYLLKALLSDIQIWGLNLLVCSEIHNGINIHESLN